MIGTIKLISMTQACILGWMTDSSSDAGGTQNSLSISLIGVGNKIPLYIIASYAK